MEKVGQIALNVLDVFVSVIDWAALLGCGAPAYWPGCRGLCDRLICIRQESWLIGCVL